MQLVRLRNLSTYLLAFVVLLATTQHTLAAPSVRSFDVAPHNSALIEWWYANSHFVGAKGHKLAVVVSFFKTGNGRTPFTGNTSVPVGHYLIIGVTDLTANSHKSYSYADHAMVKQLALIAPLIAIKGHDDPEAMALVRDVEAGRIPKPSMYIDGAATVHSAPFSLDYGSEASLSPDQSGKTMRLRFRTEGGGQYDLKFQARHPVMAVGGRGETGFTHPTDMYYFSTTCCTVTGSVRSAAGSTPVSNGLGWFDHQWGSSWGIENDGWDWFGLQLKDGREILAYRQRNLDTGEIGVTAATIMDSDGTIHVEKNALIVSRVNSDWLSPHTNIRYPLSWSISLPGQHLELTVTPDVLDQEVRVLAGGKAIWEGSSTVTGVPGGGVGFVELVGYTGH